MLRDQCLSSSLLKNNGIPFSGPDVTLLLGQGQGRARLESRSSCWLRACSTRLGKFSDLYFPLGQQNGFMLT